MFTLPSRLDDPRIAKLRELLDQATKLLDGANELVADLTEQLERLKASIRAKVEHPFRVIKRQFGYVKVRYRGLAKNTAQLHTLFALANLVIIKKTLLVQSRA